MIRLGEEEIKQLSKVTGVSTIDLQRLYEMGMLNERNSIACLVRDEYTNIRKMGKYTPAQIFFAITHKYKISDYTARSMVYLKIKPTLYCEKCGAVIRKSVYLRNEGLCDECVAMTIKLNNTDSYDEQETN